MRWRKWFVALVLAVGGLLLLFPRGAVHAGQAPSGYKVLAPLKSGNLTIFPVVAASTHNTSMFLTLDEGVRSGEVIATEAGSVQGLIRRRPAPIRPHDGAQVNTLVLVNNSKRPLLLLAGEIVTGGKQDRVIGKDRIVPPESDPIDLGVFCVEPGRWVARSDKFGAFANLAQPSVRAKAMAEKDQQQVWDSVRRSQAAVTESVTVTGEAIQLDSSSYAGAMDNKAVKRSLDKIAAPMEREYRSVIKDLHDKNAVGVVVAVNGQILWADVFASTDLLDRYWPKLVRSYAAEALTQARSNEKVTEEEAQAFLNQLDGRHETAETEPGVYRHAEITGDDYKVFELTSLLPKTDFDVHMAKMAEATTVGSIYRRPAPLQR
jgi:hypothetical protein